MKEINDISVGLVIGDIALNDYEALKEGALEYISLYDGAIVDAENYQTAKKEVASLRKIKTKLDEKRKEVKARFLEPYNSFEKQVKELIGLFDTPIETLNSQIEAIDNADKEIKRGEIKALYDDLVSLKEYLPLEDIWSDKWLNKTFDMKDIKEAILDKNMAVQSDVKIIKANCSEGALEYYKETKDLAATLENFKENLALPFDFKKYEVCFDVAKEKEFIAFMEKIGAEFKEV